MTFKDYPKVHKQRKPSEALQGMSKELARKKFNEQCDLKMDLCRQLRKCERDITKYYLTMTK